MSYFGITSLDFFEFWKQNGGDFRLSLYYDPLQTYNKNDIVFFEQAYYIGIDDNITVPPVPFLYPPKWNQTMVAGLTTESQVDIASQEALQEFNPCLFVPTYDANGNIVPNNGTYPIADVPSGFSTAQIGLIYLISHYLKRNQFATQFDGTPINVNSSNSSGERSQSFMVNNQEKASFDLKTTAYGQVYLSMTKTLRKVGATAFFG